MAKSRKYGRKQKTMRKKNRKNRKKGGCNCKNTKKYYGGNEYDNSLSARIVERNLDTVITDPTRY